MTSPLDALTGYDILPTQIIRLSTTERWGLESQADFLVKIINCGLINASLINAKSIIMIFGITYVIIFIYEADS